MNKNNAASYLPIIHALAEGKQIEVLSDTGKWDVIEDIYFYEPPNKYRIKTEPREFWINSYQDCSGRDTYVAHSSYEEAEKSKAPHRRGTIHVREVL